MISSSIAEAAPYPDEAVCKPAGWRAWPSMEEARIPWLRDRPPLNRNAGLEPEDHQWKERLVSLALSGKISLPGVEPSSSTVVRRAIDDTTYLLYHMARIVQCFFDNPNHGNYRDPFLETLFILLTWRSRIRDANGILLELCSEFQGPIRMLEHDARERISGIVDRSGFTGKRPAMVVGIVKRFTERFPDGDTAEMRSWTDGQVLDFLTSAPGVGRKSALCVLMYSLERDRFPIDAHIRRVLRRTGILSRLYDEKGEAEHRDYQVEAEEFVPPSVRRPLHTGLLAIGRGYCRPRHPMCGGCPIRSVCHTYRQNSVMLAEGRRHTHVDLFSGAGGFAIGFSKEGYRTLAAIDKYEMASETFRLNLVDVPAGNVVTADLEKTGLREIRGRLERWRDQLVPGKVDVITAGIPCQGFSKAGYRSRPGMKYDVLDDPRNHLYRIVIDWARELTPSYILIENVPGISSAGEGEENILRSVCAALERDLGYAASFGTVNAADFGVPQIRHRFILIASHPSVPRACIEELQAYAEGRNSLLTAIGDLPPLEAGSGRWYARTRDRVVTGHVARYNNEDDLKIFRALRPGERYVDFIERRRDIIEERRTSTCRAVYPTTSFSDKYHKLEPDRPSRTIVAHLNRDGNGYIHPEQTRSITPREAMRLQGFDDDFVFCGSSGAQFIQVGNAVPPPLARILARLLKTKLREAGLK